MSVYKKLPISVGDALCVVCVGGTSSEWNAYHPSDGNLRCWTLGLTSSVALGMALGLPRRRVIALDGDGSLLMNLCGLPRPCEKSPRISLRLYLTTAFMNPLAEQKQQPQMGLISPLSQRALESIAPSALLL